MAMYIAAIEAGAAMPMARYGRLSLELSSVLIQSKSAWHGSAYHLRHHFIILADRHLFQRRRTAIGEDDECLTANGW